MCSKPEPRDSTEVPRFLGNLVVPGNQPQQTADVISWDDPPPAPGRYIVVNDDGVLSVHQGRRVTLARVIGHETNEAGETGMGPQDADYDFVVFDANSQVVAIIRKSHLGDRAVRIDFDRLAEAGAG